MMTRAFCCFVNARSLRVLYVTLYLACPLFAFRCAKDAFYSACSQYRKNKTAERRSREKRARFTQMLLITVPLIAPFEMLVITE